MAELVVREIVALDDLRKYAETGALFAILDACDEPRVLEKVAELGEERAVSLYRGGPEEDLAAIAPYLVLVDTATLDWIRTNLWDDPWGIFVLSTAPLSQLRTHFRKFLIVKDPDGEDMYFRFYDPRVVGTYLSTCTLSEIRTFFGPVEAYGVGEANAVRLLRQPPPSPQRG